MINRTGWGIACALGAAVCYGFVPNLARAAFENGVPPVESTFFRTALVAVLLGIVAVARGESFAIPRAALPCFSGLAVATLIISVCYLASVQFIPVGLAVIIFFTFPVLIMLAAPLIEGHSPGLMRLLVALFAFAGSAVAVGADFHKLDIRGILLAAAAACACVLQFFSGRSLSRHMTPAVLGSLVHLVILPLTFLIALYVGSGTIQFFPGGSVTLLGLAFLSGVGLIYVAAFLIHMTSLRFAPASTVAPFYNLEPMVTTAVAALLLGERLATTQYAAGGMVFAALVAASFIRAQKIA